MPEIKIEYPKGMRFAEMTLVRMLAEKRCWNDYIEIYGALHNLRHHAKSMQDEQRHLVTNEAGVSGHHKRRNTESEGEAKILSEGLS